VASDGATRGDSSRASPLKNARRALTVHALTRSQAGWRQLRGLLNAGHDSMIVNAPCANISSSPARNVRGGRKRAVKVLLTVWWSQISTPIAEPFDENTPKVMADMFDALMPAVAADMNCAVPIGTSIQTDIWQPGAFASAVQSPKSAAAGCSAQHPTATWSQPPMSGEPASVSTHI
jgi:hypothetical protein